MFWKRKKRSVWIRIGAPAPMATGAANTTCNDIGGLTAPATTLTVEMEFDNNIIRCGFKFGTELYPLNMDTDIN